MRRSVDDGERVEPCQSCRRERVNGGRMAAYPQTKCARIVCAATKPAADSDCAQPSEACVRALARGGAVVSTRC